MGDGSGGRDTRTSGWLITARNIDSAPAYSPFVCFVTFCSTLQCFAKAPATSRIWSAVSSG